MALLCCPLPPRRRERVQPAAIRGRAVSPPPATPSPSNLLLAPSPFPCSTPASSPAASPERRMPGSSTYRRPSSAFTPSPRYFLRNASQLSSIDTAPLSRSSPALALHQDIVLVARDIWEEAYNQVRSDESLKPLVKNYEELYNTIANTGFLGSRRSSHALKEPLESDDDEERPDLGEEYFTRLAQEYLELAKKDTANQGVVSSAVQFIQKTKEAVGLAVAASPPASLAWTGICTIILPVGSCSDDAHGQMQPLTEADYRQSRRADRRQRSRLRLRHVALHVVRPAP